MAMQYTDPLADTNSTDRRFSDVTCVLEPYGSKTVVRIPQEAIDGDDDLVFAVDETTYNTSEIIVREATKHTGDLRFYRRARFDQTGEEYTYTTVEINPNLDMDNPDLDVEDH